MSAFVQLPQHHTEGISSLAFTPDRVGLVSTSLDATVALWDVATQQQSAALPAAHRDAVNCAAFLNGGQLLATGGDDRQVLIWDHRALAAPVATLTGFKDGVNKIAACPSGVIYTACDDGCLYVHKQEAGTSAVLPNEVFMAASATINDISVVPSHFGPVVVTGAEDGSLRSWIGGDADAAKAVAAQRPKEPTEEPEAEAADSVAALQDAAQSMAPEMATMAQRLLHTVDEIKIAVNHVTYHNGVVFAAIADTVLGIAYDPATAQFVGDAKAFNGQHTDYVRGICPVAPTGFVTVGDDQALVEWDSSTGGAVRKIQAHSDLVMAAASAYDEAAGAASMVATGAEDSTIRLWAMPLSTQTIQ